MSYLKMPSFRKYRTVENLVQALRSSRDSHPDYTAQASNKHGATMTSELFRISQAGFQDCPFSVNGHSRKHAKVNFQVCDNDR